jgi:L-lactate dehydrogenase complex protein LldE
MRVALFVPCYVDQLYPVVALASLELLEARGLDVDVVRAPTCCGQPLVNPGLPAAAEPVARRFERELCDYEHVVCPSGSCVATLRRHGALFGSPPDGAAARALELTELLVEVLGVDRLDVSFPFCVGVHPSCHSLRELGHGRPSELAALSGSAALSPLERLLGLVRDLRIVHPDRSDECCGFGGSFCVKEPAVSARMGQDRVRGFRQAGAQVITSADMSCLAHLGGVIERQAAPLRVMHVAQILAGRALPPGRGAVS